MLPYGSAYSQYTGGSGDGYSAGRTVFGTPATEKFTAKLTLQYKDLDELTGDGRAIFSMKSTNVALEEKNGNSWSQVASGNTGNEGKYSYTMDKSTKEYRFIAAVSGFVTAQSAPFATASGSFVSITLTLVRTNPVGHIITKLLAPDSTLTDAQFSISFMPVSAGQKVTSNGTGKIINPRLPIGKYNFVAVLTDNRYVFQGVDPADTLTGTIDLTTEDQTVYLLPTVKKK